MGACRNTLDVRNGSKEKRRRRCCRVKRTRLQHGKLAVGEVKTVARVVIETTDAAYATVGPRAIDTTT